jgi:hypothetical protein
MHLIEHTPDARAQAVYSAAVLAALDLSPSLPSGVPYALFPNVQPRMKPFAYPSLDALARRIHRDRRGDALQLRTVTVRFKDRPRSAVQVMAEDIGGRTRLIGYAWLAGKPREVLEAALERVEALDAQQGRAA